MIVCGLKLTHDGAVALIEDDRLVFSVEIEKLANSRRYSDIADLRVVSEVLAKFGYRASDVDDWVIDGWDGDRGRDLDLLDHGEPVRVRVGPYREATMSAELLEPALSKQFTIGGTLLPYTGYTHAAGHLASTYCTSPFAERGEPAFVLIWDGGLFPRLYWVDPRSGVQVGGALFPLIGHAYAMAGRHFGPFQQLPQATKADELSVAGKLMAYVALGKARPFVLDKLRVAFHEVFESDLPAAREYRRTIKGFGSLFEESRPPVDRFFTLVRQRLAPDGIADEDVLAAVHEFLEQLLVERVTEKALHWKGDGPWNLCLAGGCALNIKWNCALRASRVFSSVWVPPFPNDAGSALGAAALGMMRHTGLHPIQWHVRLGPALVPTTSLPSGWSARAASIADLAGVLHAGEPVVVLRGRAELGPRALGGRSILAPATDRTMKDKLNRIKGREFYRPVAPICLARAAPEIFAPGTPDPYMLFDHVVRPEWVSRIPAVVHIDGTARLQTVDTAGDPQLAELLHEYQNLSGIPVLCNTSANRSGCGFFPDVASAMQWGQVDQIWSEGVLYQRDAAHRD